MAEETRQAPHQIPLEWHVPEGVVSRYATNMTVQSGEHEFIISFFEVVPPLLVGSPEDVRSKLEGIRSVHANCVARIIVAADRMPEFVRVLQEHMNRRRKPAGEDAATVLVEDEHAKHGDRGC